MIYYDSEHKIFHLQNEKISYVFFCNNDNQLINLHFGSRVENSSGLLKYHRFIERGLTTCVFENDSTYSYDYIDSEYSCYGSGDYRKSALKIENANGSFINHFNYLGHEILNHKPIISGLPSFHDSSESKTLRIDLIDSISQLQLSLYYTIYDGLGVILRSSKITNHSEDVVRIERIMSSSLGLKKDKYCLLNLAGAWAQERQIKKTQLEQGCVVIDSTRGTSSSFQNPFIAVLRDNADEMQGEVYGFNLVYSGNFVNEIETNAIGQVRINQGINPAATAWYLYPNQDFFSPEALLAYSENGLNGLSQTMHRAINKHLISQNYALKKRPIMINNWEATYYDFDREKLLVIANSAKKIGIELFALDDGWFNKRNSDKTSLGDWQVDLNKLPDGLDGLAKRINDQGLEFGLWVEPEMISVDSDLYRAHPDWVLGDSTRRLSHGRFQYVLDLCNPKVVEHIIDVFTALFESTNITYVKWDMNRNLSEVFSNKIDHQSEVTHRYVLGLYKILGILTERFQNILFESCSAGGNRFDLGMLYYMPQIWTSDNTDGYARQLIQYGTSIAYPLSVMKSHISQNPNHQVMRSTHLTTKKNVATFGVLGCELDLSQVGEDERKILIEHFEFYRSKQFLIFNGDFYRICSPFEGNATAWMVIDEKEALVGYYHTLRVCNEPFVTLKLCGFRNKSNYLVTNIDSKEKHVYTGGELNKIGLCIDVIKSMSDQVTDFSSQLWHIEEINDATLV